MARYISQLREGSGGTVVAARAVTEKANDGSSYLTSFSRRASHAC